jgi:hypothetical protein
MNALLTNAEKKMSLKIWRNMALLKIQKKEKTDIFADIMSVSSPKAPPVSE